MLKEFKGYKKGIDLGGWLSQCDHTVDTYENFIKKEDFAVVKSWGCDHVRVPIDYELVEDNDGGYLEDGFKYIQRAIDWSAENGLNMILDLHKTFGYSFDKGYGELGFFDNADYQERFYKLWEVLASKYGKYSDRVAFELLNEVTEPSYCEKWNAIAKNCIERIRKIAPDTKILIGGYWNNSVSTVKFLDKPYDENIVYNFHCYEPLLFTHQAAYWVEDMPTDFRTTFDQTYGEMAKQIHEVYPRWDSNINATGKEDMKIGSEFFTELFEEAVKYADDNGVALYCGEYGVIDYATPEDTIRWYKAIHEAFEKYGIGRAAWSYREMNFGLTDARLDGVRDELTKLF